MLKIFYAIVSILTYPMRSRTSRDMENAVHALVYPHILRCNYNLYSNQVSLCSRWYSPYQSHSSLLSPVLHYMCLSKQHL